MTARHVHAEASAGTPLGDALDQTWDLDPTVPSALWDGALRAPLGEFAQRPGKALRTMACQLGWALGGGIGAAPPAVSLVVDGLHTGSLIIDDVEDGAETRRDAPAFHRLHGEAAAINSGTWLYFWSLERLAELPVAPDASLHVHRRAVSVLRRCHEGQALDLSARIDRLEASRWAPVCAAITRGKTGALVGLATELAALTAGASVERAVAVSGLGVAVGEVLQMLDDLGSVGRARRDKGHEDLRARRVTWPWAWLPLCADAVAVARLQHRARTADDVAAIDALADELDARVRDHGRGVIHATAAAAVATARDALGDHPALDVATSLLARMEASYG